MADLEARKRTPQPDDWTMFKASWTELQVYPTNDWKKHDADPECWCRPRVLDGEGYRGMTFYLHQPLDPKLRLTAPSFH